MFWGSIVVLCICLWVSGLTILMHDMHWYEIVFVSHLEISTNTECITLDFRETIKWFRIFIHIFPTFFTFLFRKKNSNKETLLPPTSLLNRRSTVGFSFAYQYHISREWLLGLLIKSLLLFMKWKLLFKFGMTDALFYLFIKSDWKFWLCPLPVSNLGA